MVNDPQVLDSEVNHRANHRHGRIRRLLRVESFLGGDTLQQRLLHDLSLVLGLVENYGSAIFGGQWKDVIAFTVLLIVLMFRPTGLLGESLGKARV